MITKEEVILAYRLMLGRDPEDENVVNSICQNIHNSHALRDVFIKSPEFQRSMAELLRKPTNTRQRHPYTLPKIPVETEVSAERLEVMFERIRKEWEHLGQTEPYWSVITQPQYYQADFEMYREQFYKSGSNSCNIFLAAIRRSGLNPAELNICLEVGCGVGRVTDYLANNFSSVIATDISKSHLDLARQYLKAKDVRNVELVHWQNILQIKQSPQVDAIFSVITLQHNPPPVIAWMLSALLDRLRSGGVAYIQIPTYRNGYMFEVERYLNSTAPSTLEMHFLPQYDVFRVIEASNCRCLEIREDSMVGDEDKMLSNSFFIQKK